MPKCSKCGKKFQTLSALNDHYRAVHPNERFVAPKSSANRNLLLGLVIVIIIVGGLVGFLIYLQSTTTQTRNTTNTQGSGILGTPISVSLYNNMTGVSPSTLSAVGLGSVNNKPAAVSGSALTSGGKPEVLYIGTDYCPFCASERWSIVVALSKFGNFTNLGYMLSAANDQNLSTVTFYQSSYTSNYIAFVSVEEQDRSGATLQTPTQDQANLLNQYDSRGSIPFVDIGNQYVVVGSEYPMTDLKGLSWTQIGSQLNNPSSSIARDIDSGANALITAICKVDGGQPFNVCDQSFAKLPLVIMPPTSPATLIANFTMVLAAPFVMGRQKRRLGLDCK